MAFFSITGLHAYDLIETPFFQGIKNLNGFKKLILQANSYYTHKDRLLENTDVAGETEAEALVASRRYRDKEFYYDSLVPTGYHAKICANGWAAPTV